MKTYTVHECEITGKKFCDKQSCLEHEAQARRDIINENIRQAKKDQIEQTFARGLVSPEETYVKKYIEDWIRHYNEINLEITMVNLRYDALASNSHCAPYGKETNWGGDKKDVPRGYPGLVGRIEGRFVEPLREYKDWTSRKKLVDSFSELCDDSYSFGGPDCVFKMKGLHSGTGGGSHKSFSYGVTLFIDDFPRLRRYFLKEKLKEGIY